MRAKVWNGKKTVTVTGVLKPFDEDKLAKATGTMTDAYKKVSLFHAGRKWWLHYPGQGLTGAFRTKAAAMDWYVKGGR